MGVFIFWVRSSSFFGSGRLHFLGQVVFLFWVRSSSFFGSGRLHFWDHVVFLFWVRSSSFFGSGRLHFLGQVVFIFWTNKTELRLIRRMSCKLNLDFCVGWKDESEVKTASAFVFQGREPDICYTNISVSKTLLFIFGRNIY